MRNSTVAANQVKTLDQETKFLQETEGLGAGSRSLTVFLAVSCAWFGLATGVAEVGVLYFRKVVLDKTMNQGPDVVWMAPLADLVLFAGPALILRLLARYLSGVAAVRIATFVYAFLALFSLLFMFHPQLHRFAGMLLAAGIAVQISRIVATRSRAFRAFAARSLKWIVALIVAVTAGIYAWQYITERSAISALAPAPERSPNVLMIVLDTVRAKSMSAYGYERKTTPHLEQFAGTAVKFEMAVSTAPWTLPSHASMFTGRYPHELATGWTRALDARFPTLAEVLRSNGYLTAGFVANTGYGS
jgi:hypothetical protein